MKIHEKGESVVRLIISEGMNVVNELQKGVKRKADKTLKGFMLASISSSMVTCGVMFGMLVDNESVVSFMFFEVPAHLLLTAIGFCLLVYSVRLIYFTRVLNVDRDQLLIKFALKVADKIFEENSANDMNDIKNLLIKLDEIEKALNSLEGSDEKVKPIVARSVSR